MLSKVVLLSTKAPVAVTTDQTKNAIQFQTYPMGRLKCQLNGKLQSNPKLSQHIAQQTNGDQFWCCRNKAYIFSGKKNFYGTFKQVSSNASE